MATFHYFPLYARGELIRYIFHHTETEFTDHVIQFSEWGAMKAANFSPGGSLPVLEIDGHTLSNSIACATYLASKTDIFPEDNWQKWATLAIIDHIEDVIANFLLKVFKGDEAGAQEWWTGAKALKLGFIENILKANNEGNGFFFGDKISMADLAVYQFLNDWFLSEQFREARGADIEAFPALKAFADRMAEASPGLKKYLESRPVYTF